MEGKCTVVQRRKSVCAEQKEARQCKHGGEETEAFRQLEGCGSGNDHC